MGSATLELRYIPTVTSSTGQTTMTEQLGPLSVLFRQANL